MYGTTLLRLPLESNRKPQVPAGKQKPGLQQRHGIGVPLVVRCKRTLQSSYIFARTRDKRDLLTDPAETLRSAPREEVATDFRGSTCVRVLHLHAVNASDRRQLWNVVCVRIARETART